jgi:hypothetical protein
MIVQSPLVVQDIGPGAQPGTAAVFKGGIEFRKFEPILKVLSTARKVGFSA